MINQIRAFLLERGMTFRRGRKYLQQRMPLILEDAEQNLSPLLRQLLDQLWQEWKVLTSQIEAISGQIERIAQQGAVCQRLQHIRRGAAGGDCHGSRHRKRIGIGERARLRRVVGLGPATTLHRRQGELLGISKRGNPYLRRLFIHGARSISRQAHRDRRRWTRG